MDVFIAVCISLAIGLVVGFASAWYIQKKRLEEGFNKWNEVKVVNQYGRRIRATVISVDSREAPYYNIVAKWQSPDSNRSYTFKRTFLSTENSRAFIRELYSILSVSVVVYFDRTSQNYWYWMERPW